MNPTTTLCMACKRPGTSTCSWDKSFTPVEGWTARKNRINISGRGYEYTYHVMECPLFIQDRDPDVLDDLDDLEDIDKARERLWNQVKYQQNREKHLQRVKEYQASKRTGGK